VQDALEAALRSVGENAPAIGAGRTDAGVHAKCQVAHFDASRDWEPRRLAPALNVHLPQSVSVMKATAARDDFHARKSALWREYRYFIWNSPTCYPHLKPYVLWLSGSHYDWTRVFAPVSSLVGEHDFGAFCRAGDRPENTIRTVKYARFFKRGRLVVFRIVANSYLTNMIRIVVGNLLAVAAGRYDDIWFRSLLGGERDIGKSAKTVSPSGLFLWKITYPDQGKPQTTS
jgi:tRNA pseudouridine38-40 synthase